MENDSNREYLEKMALKEEMRYFSYTNQFYKLYDLFFELTSEQREELDNVRFYCYSKLGYIKEKDISNLKSYAKKQMIYYNEDLFNEFIATHRYDTCENKYIRKDKLFDKDFPLHKVIKEVKKNLDYDKCTCTGFYTDQYVFKYDSCGKDKGVFQNYFKVLCLHGTSDILTMFPARGCEKLDHVDLNYLNENQGNNRPSQIDKFYKRFGEKNKIIR